MKNNKTLKISALVLSVLLVVSYVLYQVVLASKAKMETRIAISTTEYKTIDSKCFVLRDEKYLKNTVKGTTLSFVTDGERVAKGDTVSLVFSNTDDADAYLKINELKSQVEHYKELSGQANLQVKNIDSLDAHINDNLTNYLTAIDSKNFSAVYDCVDALRNSISSRQIATGGTLNFDARLAELQNELSALQATKISYTDVKAETAGYYINGADGYENTLDYSKVDSLKADDVTKAIESKPSAVDGDITGRTVGEFKWYILTVVDSDATVDIKSGQSLTVNFPYAGVEKIPVTVYKIGDRSEDKTLLILSCELMNSSLADFRIENIQIVKAEYTGYKIPNSAIRTVDGEKGVYVVSGNLLGFRKVNIAYSTENYSIVDNPDGESDYIKLYDKVVIKGVELYDDKLV